MSAYTAFDGIFELVPVDGGYFRARAELAWEIGVKGSGLWVVVPATFLSDGPTIPLIARPFFSRADPRFQKAARLHDWCLACGWTAWTSTAIFYDALAADGVPRAKRWAMAFAVLAWIATRPSAEAAM